MMIQRQIFLHPSHSQKSIKFPINFHLRFNFFTIFLSLPPAVLLNFFPQHFFLWCYFFIFIVLIKIFLSLWKLHFQSIAKKAQKKLFEIETRLEKKFFKLICFNLEGERERERLKGAAVKRKSKCQEANQ